jgi:lipopolysaccharide export system permease protein
MFDLSTFQLTRTDENLFKKNYEMQNINQLGHAIDSIKTQLKADKYNYDISYMNNLPFYNKLAANKFVPVKRPDTAKSVKSVEFISNVISYFPLQDRPVILETARNGAMAAKQNLEINRDNLLTKSRLVYKHQIVFHKKFSFSLACFLLFFIGAPLGAIIRKGGLGMPAVISTLFFILFWIISFMGEKYSAEGVLPAWEGMWIASAVLLPIGIFLTLKATNDASLLDIDAWTRFFNKLLKIPEQRI